MPTHECKQEHRLLFLERQEAKMGEKLDNLIKQLDSLTNSLNKLVWTLIPMVFTGFVYLFLHFLGKVWFIMMYINQSRWKSKVAWVSLISLVLFILKNYYNIEIANIDKLIELVLVTLTAFGVFNNPESKEKY